MDGHPNSSPTTWSALAWLANCLVVCTKNLVLFYFPLKSHDTISQKSNYNPPLKDQQRDISIKKNEAKA